MVNDKDIVFVTTTLNTKWLNYQKRLIKNMFPDSKHIIVDGGKNWPNSWFYWIDEVKKCGLETCMTLGMLTEEQSKKLKNSGLVGLGVVAGIAISLQFSAMAQKPTDPPLPLEELRQLADVFGLIKSDYVEYFRRIN